MSPMISVQRMLYLCIRLLNLHPVYECDNWCITLMCKTMHSKSKTLSPKETSFVQFSVLINHSHKRAACITRDQIPCAHPLL